MFLFLKTFLVTFFSVPTIKKIAYANNFLDKPDYRKQKIKLMVRIGGGSFVLGYFVAITLLLLNYQLRKNLGLDFSVFKILFLGSSCFYTIGLIDDIFSISPFKRLVLQIFVALIIWSLGFKIYPPNLEIFNTIF